MREFIEYYIRLFIWKRSKIIFLWQKESMLFYADKTQTAMSLLVSIRIWYFIMLTEEEE